MHCLYFPPEVGGLESHVHQLCRGLAARGHDVRVVTSRSVAGTPQHEVMDGVEVWRTWFPARNALGWGLAAAGATPRTAHVARGADVIHAQAFASVVPAAWASRRRRVPLVTTFHTSHFLRLAADPVWRPLLAWTVRAGDRNLAASRELADVAQALAPGAAVEALPNGVDTDTFRPVVPSLPATEGRRRVIVPRRLFAKNGVEYFVRALPRVLEGSDVDALVVGEGPERRRLEALAAELGVAERIRFLGAMPHAAMPAALSWAELAVFPSLMEATSVAALECMACEVPVAASRVGGLPEIVDDDVGGLFEPADPESLARSVLRLLGDPGLAERGRRARERVVERWSNDRLVERHLEVYGDLVARRTGGSR